MGALEASDRLRELLGKPALAGLLEKLRSRYSKGNYELGILRYEVSSAAEREEIERLLGKTPSMSNTVVFRLADLEGILKSAGLADSLYDAVVSLTGSVVDRRKQNEDSILQWSEVFSKFPTFPEKLRPLVKRLSHGNPSEASVLLQDFQNIMGHLSSSGENHRIYLSELAALAVGDSHALDLGAPLETLILASVDKVPEQDRRTVWRSLGVKLDDVSAPLLVLNFRVEAKHLLGRTLCEFADVGEPFRLTLRQLQRFPLTLTHAFGPKVWVCENPTVLMAFADQLGPRCPPMICIDGKPKTTAHQLLQVLKSFAIEIRYHGDFDWEGIRIGNLMVERYGVKPWAFDAQDYLRAPRNLKSLQGAPVPAQWDTKLQEVMMEKGYAVYEEAMIAEMIYRIIN